MIKYKDCIQTVDIYSVQLKIKREKLENIILYIYSFLKKYNPQSLPCTL